MADIEIEKQHGLEFSEARVQAKRWLEEAKQEFNFDADYIEGDTQDTLNIRRTGVTGNALLDANKLRFEAKLAFIAKPLKGKIRQEINDGLDKYFS